MCPQEHFSHIISNTTGLSFVKRFGPFPATILAQSCLLVLYSFVITKPIKICLLVFAVKPCSKPLVNTFCSSLGSTLLLIKMTTIDPYNCGSSVVYYTCMHFFRDPNFKKKYLQNHSSELRTVFTIVFLVSRFSKQYPISIGFEKVIFLYF